MRQHSKEAWDIASQYSHVLASETRDLAAQIDDLITKLRAERDAAARDMRERCAEVADPISYEGLDEASDLEKQAYDIRFVIAADIRALPIIATDREVQS